MNGLSKAGSLGNGVRVGVCRVLAFTVGPAIVRPFFNDVYFFIGPLPDVSGPQFLSFRVEAESPGVA